MKRIKRRHKKTSKGNGQGEEGHSDDDHSSNEQKREQANENRDQALE